jgi:hypothetical protein
MPPPKLERSPHPLAVLDPRSDAFKNVVLTYDNSVLTDGVGAQLQRIYGIYSIARLLGASYVHSPLARVDYQGLAALETNVLDPAFESGFNDLLTIDSDLELTVDFHALRLRDMSLETFYQLGEEIAQRGEGHRPTLVRLLSPYAIADRFPDCYEVCKEISPFTAAAPTTRQLRVALHVRRGELFVVDSDRMLPNQYYVDVGLHIARTLDALGLDYQIEVCTEVPTGAVLVRPGAQGIADRISTPVLLSPEMCHLEDFSALPRSMCSVNEGALDCLRRLATADILVMSRSSFSYLAAILNRRGIVLYHPFWHAALSPWISTSPEGHFDGARFAAALAAQRGRS